MELLTTTYETAQVRLGLEATINQAVNGTSHIFNKKVPNA